MWSRIDDKLANHPKIQQAGAILGENGRAIALGFFTAALSRANEYLTDGFLSTAVIDGLVSHVSKPRQIADVLTKVRLFDRKSGGYAIHDFWDWNPTAESVRKRRKDRHLQRMTALR
jgi:hypothetical protein